MANIINISFIICCKNLEIRVLSFPEPWLLCIMWETKALASNLNWWLLLVIVIISVCPNDCWFSTCWSATISLKFLFAIYIKVAVCSITLHLKYCHSITCHIIVWTMSSLVTCTNLDILMLCLFRTTVVVMTWIHSVLDFQSDCWEGNTKNI